MKKLLAMILAALMLLSVTACGKKNETADGDKGAGKKEEAVTEEKEYDEGPLAEITWNLSEDGVLTVNGKGRMPEYYNDADMLIDRPWEKSTDSITSVVIGDGITSISSHAFMFCRGLVSVTIPDSVVSIGDNAFYCCYSLGSLSIPSSVKMIGDYAFKGCHQLELGGSASFGGTMTQWNKITFGEESIAVGKIICSDGEVRNENAAPVVPDEQITE